MRIVKAETLTSETLDQLVSIHMEQLKAGFLPVLGPKVLRRIYRHATKQAHLYLAKEDDEVAGFVMGALNPSQFYKKFALLNFFPVSLAIAKRPSVFFRALSGAKYAAESSNEAGPELLSIAVNPKFLRRGIGQELFRVFQRAMRDEGVSTFHIVMADTQKVAAEFYKKQNCRFDGEQTIGGLRCFNLIAPTTT